LKDLGDIAYWRLKELSKDTPQPLYLHVSFDMEAITHCRSIVELVFRRAGNKGAVLDIGAGDRRLKQELLDLGFQGIYRSLDIDPLHEHDFYDMDHVQGKYNCIVLFDFIEHVHYTVAASYLKKCPDLLTDDGFVVLSTPNIDHYNCLWRTDMTHCQQYPIHHLYALLRIVGFEGKIGLYRIFMTWEKQGWKRRLLLEVILTPLMKAFRRISQVDFAQEILVFSYKK
jgi:SAM-dependent methyltransferase